MKKIYDVNQLLKPVRLYEQDSDAIEAEDVDKNDGQEKNDKNDQKNDGKNKNDEQASEQQPEQQTEQNAEDDSTDTQKWS